MSPLQGKLSALVLCATALVFCNPARADLVTNGGFETGDFTGWTQTGNTAFDGVLCPGSWPYRAQREFQRVFRASRFAWRYYPEPRTTPGAHTASIFSCCLMAVPRALLAQHSVGPC